MSSGDYFWWGCEHQALAQQIQDQPSQPDKVQT